MDVGRRKGYGPSEIRKAMPAWTSAESGAADEIFISLRTRT